MSDIQIYKGDPTNQVSTIKNMLEGILVNNVNDFSLFETLKVFYLKLHADLKQKVPENDADITYVIQGIIRNMRVKKTNIRIDEILFAWENGIAEEYGKYFGLSVISLNKFIAEYLKDPNRIEALRVKNLPPSTNYVPNELERFKTSKFNALAGYSNYLKNSTSGTYGAVIYDFLFSIRMFSITQDDIDECMKRGSDLYYHQLKEKSQAQKDVLRRKEVDVQVQKFLDKMMADNQKPDADNPIVVSLAKRIYIDDIYAGYVFEDISIYELDQMIDKYKPE